VSEEFPVFAVDLRGHGRSDWPGTYSIELFAHDVCGALEQLQVGPIHLVGRSLGGLVACKVAAAVPDLVRTLVLEDVGMPHPRVAATPDRPEGPLAFDWAVVEQVRPEIDNPAPSWADVIARIDAPTLVITGAVDFICGPDCAADIAAGISGSKQVLIEDCGHFTFIEQPERFRDEVTQFLA
jgi:pimeloyl-ACP methyl ester carboxylesterase